MMHRFFNNGYYGNGACSGLFNSGWNLIVIGTAITIAIIFYIWRNTKNKKDSSDIAYETLKMKYVQGDITEEEFLKRKEIIDKK